MTIHLVNLTNPMMMKGPVREILPISSQQVSFSIPPGRRVGRARLLVAAKDVPYSADRGRISLEVPSVELHELIAVDFAG